MGPTTSRTKSRSRWLARQTIGASSGRLPARAASATVAPVLIALVLAACGDSDQGAAPTAVPGLSHVHGLGLNPANGDLYAATHFGLFRVPANGEAERVGESFQDTMGFTVAGPDRFLASGHPDTRGQPLRPPGRPLLGLIQSTDAGRSWQSLSLLGEADFHALVAAHGNVYGYDSTGRRFMVSADGRQWDTRSQLALADFAVDPADADHVVATTGRGLAESGDGGRTWEAIDGPLLAFVSWSKQVGLWGLGPDGETYRRVEGRWEPRQPLTGRPQALLATDSELFAAASEGERTAIYVSSDESRSWQLRYSERQR